MSAPIARIRISRNGGRTWSDWRERSLGEIGDFAKRVKWSRFGRSRQFVMEISVVSSRQTNLLAASIAPEATR